MNADRPSRLDVSPQELQPPGSGQPAPARRRVEPDASVQQRFDDAMARSREGQARQGRAEVIAPSMLMGLGHLAAWEPGLPGQPNQHGDSTDTGDAQSGQERGRQDSPRTGTTGLRQESALSLGPRARVAEALTGDTGSGIDRGTEELRLSSEATPHKIHAPLAEAGATVTQAYGLVSAAFRVDASAHASERTALNQRLTTVIAGLYVGEGAHGGKQVRLEMKEDALPGVTVVIEEVGGRMQIDFTCSVEASRLRLNEAVPEVAPDVAVRLERDVLMRVQTDDEEDRRLFEVAASPQPPTG